MKIGGGIADKILAGVVAVALLAAFAPIVIVFLGNLTTAMSGTALSALFATSFLTLLFGIFVLIYVFKVFKH